jgi:hypothetical protein
MPLLTSRLSVVRRPSPSRNLDAVSGENGSHILHYNLVDDLHPVHRRRAREDDDEDYIEFVGRFEPRRRIQHEVEIVELDETGTPLREVSDTPEETCRHCGHALDMGPAERNGRGRGSGSTTLSLRVRANLLGESEHLLLW